MKGREKRKAIAAKKFTRKFCKNKKMELRNMSRGKYFRIVADVYCDDRNLGKALLKKRLAKKYKSKKKKKGWLF